MLNVEIMSIALTPELAAAGRAAVESGEYVSSSEAVRDALRNWQLRRFLHGREVEELRRLWQEGVDSGPSWVARLSWSGQPMKTRMRRKNDQEASAWNRFKAEPRLNHSSCDSPKE